MRWYSIKEKNIVNNLGPPNNKIAFTKREEEKHKSVHPKKETKINKLQLNSSKEAQHSSVWTRPLILSSFALLGRGFYAESI